MTVALRRRTASRTRREAKIETSPSAARALDWVRSHEARGGGIRIHSGRRDAYPEVTGYLIPTLLEYGERELATRCLRWLLGSQRADGSFPGPRVVPYVFDTGQVLRGLLAGDGLLSEARPAARRSAEYLIGQMVEGGQGGFGPRYGDGTPEAIHLYVLGPLYRAAEMFGDGAYRAAADRCLGFYRAQEATLRLDDLTHFLAYELEALIDVGRPDVAAPVLDALRERQAPDGSVPARGGSAWVCAPGLAQLAVCWYKIGEREPADRAMGWLEAHQRPSGGFLGSYGPGAAYFPQVEPSWAAKFYLDAVSWRRSNRLPGPRGGLTTEPAPRASRNPMERDE